MSVQNKKAEIAHDFTSPAHALTGIFFKPNIAAGNMAQL